MAEQSLPFVPHELLELHELINSEITCTTPLLWKAYHGGPCGVSEG